MSLKQLLLLTALVLLFTLQRATGLAAQVESAQQQAKQAQQEVAEARKLTLASEKI